jgi:transposase
MGSQSRRRWSAEEKLAIIEEARQTGQTVSEVCRRHGIATGLFYVWEKKARQGALEGLRAGKRKQSRREAQLEEEITRLRAVAAELSAENLELKKGRWP